MKKNIFKTILTVVMALALGGISATSLYAQEKLKITHDVIDDKGTAGFFITVPVNDTDIKLGIEDTEDGRLIKNFFVAAYNKGLAANDILATVCSWGELIEDGGIYKIYNFGFSEKGQIFYGVMPVDDAGTDYRLTFIYCRKGDN